MPVTDLLSYKLICLPTLRLFGLGGLLLLGFFSCSPGDPSGYDLLISNGTLYDGNGGDPYQADIGIVGERIVAIGELDEKAGEIIAYSGEDEHQFRRNVNT